MEHVLLENYSNLLYWLLCWQAVNLQMNRTMKYQGVLSRIVGFLGKCFLFSPPLPPSIFFCSHSNFRAITRLEMLPTQATKFKTWDIHFLSKPLFPKSSNLCQCPLKNEIRRFFFFPHFFWGKAKPPFSKTHHPWGGVWIKNAAFLSKTVWFTWNCYDSLCRLA